MIKVAIVGAGGRMGRRLVALGTEAENLTVTGAVEVPGHTEIGQDAGELAGVGAIGVKLTDDVTDALSGADVAVAFTNTPDSAAELGAGCAKAGVALVMGTTGLGDDQMQAFRDAVKAIPVVYATNFSAGITVLLGLVEQAAGLLGDGFDCEIVESHHTRKKDAPSGTAKSLAEAAAKAKGWALSDVARGGREGFIGERPHEEIGIHAVRAGDIVGHHTVLFGGTGETLELVHRAQSRDTFVSGALRAAGWVVGKPSGIYDMRDVLGLR